MVPALKLPLLKPDTPSSEVLGSHIFDCIGCGFVESLDQIAALV